MVTSSTMTPAEAGEFIRKRRKSLHLTQEQVCEMANIPFATYLSNMEKGKISVGNSQYFGALVKVLRLTSDEIQQINPNLIVNVNTETSDVPGPNPTYEYREEGLELPESLKIAIERYGDDFPEFRDPEWQQSLAGVRFRGEPIDTPRDWLEYLQFALRVLNKRKR